MRLKINYARNLSKYPASLSDVPSEEHQTNLPGNLSIVMDLFSFFPSSLQAVLQTVFIIEMFSSISLLPIKRLLKLKIIMLE